MQATRLIAAERDNSRQCVESGGAPLEPLAGLEERVRGLQPAPAHSRPVWSARAQPPVGARGPVPAARLRERRAPAAARIRLRAAHYVPRTPARARLLQAQSLSYVELVGAFCLWYGCFSCHLPPSRVAHSPRLQFACEYE